MATKDANLITHLFPDNRLIVRSKQMEKEISCGDFCFCLIMEKSISYRLQDMENMENMNNNDIANGLKSTFIF